MADEPTTPPAESGTDDKPDVEKEAFLERLKGESAKRKEAEQRAAKTERELAEIRTQLEEREQAGLPELEQVRKRLEAAEKRAQEADARAQEADTRLTRAQRERWVTQAASAQNFIDPSEAALYVNLDDVESAEEAERAVKKVAKTRAHLLKGEEPRLPGRVLENGQPATGQKKPGSNIDLSAEAEMLAEGLKKFASK